MWPSMQQQRKAPPKPNIVPKPSIGNLDSLKDIEWTQFSVDEFHAEKIALEKWLDSDDSWPTVAPVEPYMSAVPLDSSSSKGQEHTQAAFDDDFSDFVSAPSQAFVTPDATSKSLADDADSETEYNHDRGDPEDDLFSDDFFPTDQEILVTSHRIFGPLLPSQRASSSAQADGERKYDEDEDEENTLGDVDFDLSRITGVLQGLKEEISGIEDEDVKRRMAARVAMGLLYGLEG
jgi:hypothetical protein